MKTNRYLLKWNDNLLKGNVYIYVGRINELLYEDNMKLTILNQIQSI